MRETGERETELSATLLPVLVKCCVLLKRQPRMCQPSHLALPNGLLNADIKLTRSYALPFSFLSTLCSHYLSFSPCPSPCHSLVLSLSFTTFQLLCLSTSHSFPYFPHSLYPCRYLLHSRLPEPFQQVVFYVSQINISPASLSPSIGSIMPSTHTSHRSLSPCCTSCQHHSTAQPMPLFLVWIGIGGTYSAPLACRYDNYTCIQVHQQPYSHTEMPYQSGPLVML